ncbi:Z1 domain-containing protein [Vibrio jasicida]|uniref:Z1 domain-containing protein n=1 Tax=Vibrio jasicida TaxID=766224 RepID=UPI001642158F|nr:Z1 domain-containing protein [Vibrio jasicida]
MSEVKQLLNVVESALFEQPKKSSIELRDTIKLLANAIAPTLNDIDLEHIAREIEIKQGIKAGLASFVDREDFEPWLDDAKINIDPFYWQRYKKLLLQSGFPRDVITSTDTITDKILSRLGNPKDNNSWDRRGMVVGHVQSGKTANYTGLICKAADAGYRLIIVIAGIHNNLRNQTQLRIDEGFIGRDTGKSREKHSSNTRHVIGVGHFDQNRTPVSLTNTLRDFNKETASTNTSEIDSYKVPVVLVIKKNHRTLTNLLDWLKDNSARGDRDMIDQPMLLIDDEADNASINTKYSDKLVTTINGQIRDLLKMFHRSCYVGYTATPFANIFIDPEQDHEMHKEDLFPKDFIIGLDAPSNYFGPKKIFIDDLDQDRSPTWLRYISDTINPLPIKHRIDLPVNTLPQTLLIALRAFLLARTIRNLRGQSSSHCSMLVNASRFTAVQSRIKNRLHEALERIQNSLRVYGADMKLAMQDEEIKGLYEVWDVEFSNCEFVWKEVLSELFNAVASAKVVEVNSRANDLDYTATSDKGQTVVAVGGFSLSRGLTLEGLTTTWFHRNTMMYDTLMQMGRWFGYRNGYEDLCRIWMPEDAIDWYSFIASAAEELHGDLRLMDQARATPKQFGLAVRSHPASLLVTARNKMGSSKTVLTRVGLSNSYIETAIVSLKKDDLALNWELANKFVEHINTSKFSEGEVVSGNGYLIKNVPVEIVDEFLAKWKNASESVSTEPKSVREYIKSGQYNELKSWDVLIPSLSLSNGKEGIMLGRKIRPVTRYVGLQDLVHNFMSFSGKRMRVASRGIEKNGVDLDKALAAEHKYNQDNAATSNYPDKIYRTVRNNPLFVLHVVQAKPPKNKEQDDAVSLIPKHPVIAWGISFPMSELNQEKVEYVVNTTRYREIFGEEDIDEELEGVFYEN